MFNFDSQGSDIIIGSLEIPHDFNTRFISWYTRILPDRLGAIQSQQSNKYIYRMTNLLFEDKYRLNDRIVKECDDPIIFKLKCRALNYVFDKELTKYHNELV